MPHTMVWSDFLSGRATRIWADIHTFVGPLVTKPMDSGLMRTHEAAMEGQCARLSVQPQLPANSIE